MMDDQDSGPYISINLEERNMKPSEKCVKNTIPGYKVKVLLLF